MEMPPVIAAQKSTRMRDFHIRCVFAVIIGIVGYWYPEWYASRIPPELDSRVGIVFIHTLPFIFAAAAWATASFKWEYRPRSVSAGLLLLVWAPVLIFGTRMFLVSLYVGNLLRNPH